MSRYEPPSQHRIYMQFTLRQEWQITFLEADLKSPLPRTLTFHDPEKIREMARRGGALATSENKTLLEYAIRTGQGGVFLNLTPEQYKHLTVVPRAAAPLPAKVQPRRALYPYKPKQSSYGGRR